MNIKKHQKEIMEVKNTIIELENLVEQLNNRLDQRKERISGLENGSLISSIREAKRKKRKKKNPRKNKEILRDLKVVMKQINTHKGYMLERKNIPKDHKKNNK